ncbi:MAG: alpha/beta hydrolase family protein [Cyclobacteriaceae bacterium]
MSLTKILDPKPLISSHHQRPISYDLRYLPDGTPKPILLFIHGFKGFKDWGYFNLLADTMAEKGFVFIKMNLSHNGTTPKNLTEFVDLEAFGHNNFSIELDDIGTMLDYLVSPDFSLSGREADRERLYLMGHSRGGSLALLKTFEDTRIAAAITLAAVTNWEERWPDYYLDEWKEKGVQMIQNTRTGQEMPLYYQMVENYYKNRERLNLPEIIKKLQTPVLAFHGTKDETVPVRMAHDLDTWSGNAQVEIIEGADHTFGGKHPYDQEELPKHVRYIVEMSNSFLKNLRAL